MYYPDDLENYRNDLEIYNLIIEVLKNEGYTLSIINLISRDKDPCLIKNITFFRRITTQFIYIVIKLSFNCILLYINNYFICYKMANHNYLESWDSKLENVEKTLRESFWGDFLIGGLLVSGIFICIESLNLPPENNFWIGIFLVGCSFFLIAIMFLYCRHKKSQITDQIREAENYILANNFNKALNCLNLLLQDKRFLKIKEIWNNKGVALYYLKRYEEALECFNFALEIDAFYKYPLNAKIIIFEKMGRVEEALKFSNKAITLDEKFKEAWYNKGNIMSKLKRYEDALKCYDKAVKIDKNYTIGWYNRGNVLMDLKRYEEALKSYDIVLSLNPTNKKAFYNKACVYSIQKEVELAIDFLKIAIELDPEYKITAKSDLDFQNIRNLEEFQSLTS